MKLRGTFIFIWKVLDYKDYRLELLQLANGIVVPLRFTIGRYSGSKPSALSRKVAGSEPLLFLYCLFGTFSGEFLVNQKNSNPLVDVGSNSSVA